MKKLISCEYNFDNGCVELKFTDGSMVKIDTIAVENEVARNMYERSESDCLDPQCSFGVCRANLEWQFRNLFENRKRILTIRWLTNLPLVGKPCGRYFPASVNLPNLV